MRYEDAFKRVVDKLTAEDPNFKGVTEQTDKIAAFVWNVVAMGLTENKLDDFVMISKDNSVISLPLTKNESPKRDVMDEHEPKKTKKASKKSTETDDNVAATESSEGDDTGDSRE